MINKTYDIIILKDDEELKKDIGEAIAATKRLMAKRYNYGNPISPSAITAGRDNGLKYAAFVKFVPSYSPKHDKEWLRKVHDACNEFSTNSKLNNPLDLVSNIYFNEPVKRTMLEPLVRGLRAMLVYLWSKKAVLLPMNFTLPRSSKYANFAEDFYTEVLRIYRSPSLSESMIGEGQDVTPFLPSSSKANFLYYAWRPIIASDWHTIEDVNNEDVIQLFSELKRRRDSKDVGGEEIIYPISAASMFSPLVRISPSRANLDIRKITEVNPSLTITSKKLEEELSYGELDVAHLDVKAEWSKLQKEYLHNLQVIKRKKQLKPDETAIGKLMSYLFGDLPGLGIEPPMPKQLSRKFIVGSGVPSLMERYKKGAEQSSLSRFFDFIEDISESYESTKGFANPISIYDIKKQSRPIGTNKKPFTPSNVRFVLETLYALADFAHYVNMAIVRGRDKKLWQRDLQTTSVKVIDAEDFGYVPIVRYKSLSGQPISVNLRYIPSALLRSCYVPLDKEKGVYKSIIATTYLHQIIVGLNTGLRLIHVRWLDKTSFKDGDVCDKYNMFELFVNTDKGGTPWVRPTSKNVLIFLERQLQIQKYIDSDHFDTELDYDGHEYSPYGKIRPIFMEYDKPRVYSGESVGAYYRKLMYYISLVKISLGESPLGKMPNRVWALDFKEKAGFEEGIEYIGEYKTEYTPHGVRSTISTMYSLVVQPDIIGGYVTGHKNNNLVKHYVKLDREYWDEIQLLKSSAPDSIGDRISYPFEHVFAPRGDNSDSPLMKSLSELPIERVLDEFGAISGVEINNKGEIESGLGLLSQEGVGQLKPMGTHLCPLGAVCPSEVKETIGEKACGQCHFSIKTVDHLPRIYAQCRSLEQQIKLKKEHLVDAANRQVPESGIEEMENKILQIASELAAWALTCDALSKNRERLKGRMLVNNPLVLSQKIIEMESGDAELEKLLLACEDAVAYPELNSAELVNQVAMYSFKIFTSDPMLSSFFPQGSGLNMIDKFRGDIRAVCHAANMSPAQLGKFIEENPPQISTSPTMLLESLQDKETE